MRAEDECRARRGFTATSAIGTRCPVPGSGHRPSSTRCAEPGVLKVGDGIASDGLSSPARRAAPRVSCGVILFDPLGTQDMGPGTRRSRGDEKGPPRIGRSHVTVLALAVALRAGRRGGRRRALQFKSGQGVRRRPSRGCRHAALAHAPREDVQPLAPRLTAEVKEGRMDAIKGFAGSRLRSRRQRGRSPDALRTAKEPDIRAAIPGALDG